MSAPLSDRFASLKRDGRAALVAFTLVLASIAASTAHASADTLLSNTLQLVDGSTVIECPARYQRQTDAEFACVSFATQTVEGLRIFNAYRDQLSEDGWVFSHQAPDGFLFLRWLNADCIERLFVLVPVPGTAMFGRSTLPACGNERYNGDNAAETPARLRPEALGDRLFQSGLDVRAVSASTVVDCPSAVQSPEIDVVCLRFEEGADGASTLSAYFEQMSRDRWLFNNVMPPVYLFSRWLNANCIDRVLLGGVDQAPGIFVFAHFRQPACGEERYGEQP